MKFRNAIIERLGEAVIRAAERRLCQHCHFETPGIAALCSLMPLMVPLTYTGLDCPYYCPRDLTKCAVQATCEACGTTKTP